MKMTKKKVLGISLTISIFLTIASYLGNSKLCSLLKAEHYSCIDFSYLIEMILLPFWPITAFSLITYKMREEVFRAWIRFSYIWVPFSMLLVLITPDGQGGSFGIPSLIDKQVVAFLTSLIFVVVSLLIIAVKSWKLRGK